MHVDRADRPTACSALFHPHLHRTLASRQRAPLSTRSGQTTRNLLDSARDSSSIHPSLPVNLARTAKQHAHARRSHRQTPLTRPLRPTARRTRSRRAQHCRLPRRIDRRAAVSLRRTATPTLSYPRSLAGLLRRASSGCFTRATAAGCSTDVATTGSGLSRPCRTVSASLG